jgi:hypothetical protein
LSGILNRDYSVYFQNVKIELVVLLNVLEEKMTNQFLDGHGPEGTKGVAAANVECVVGA